jgi:hypothetical protein
MPKFETIEATAPASWASYLINGDASGIDDDDVALADRFAEYIGAPIVDVSEDTFFSRYCDAPGVTLADDMATYSALLEIAES